MKKLKTKVFLIIFVILTLFTTGIFCAYNAQLYNQQRRGIEHSLNQTEVGFGLFEDFGNSPFGREDREKIGNIRFMDTTVYTVILDDDNAVSFIINHSDNDVSDSEIESIAQNIISEGKSEKIGNLYISDYSYKYDECSYVTIVDDSAPKHILLTTLFFSLAVYALIEVLIFLIARKLALWISEPVEESFGKQKQFIADASHELKTPLAVIMASADALESNPDESKWLGNIKSEADRMNKLISDLLELAKSEEVDDKSQFEISNLSKTVEMSCLTFEGVMFEKGIALNYDIDENTEYNMNPYKIYQIKER